MMAGASLLTLLGDVALMTKMAAKKIAALFPTDIRKV